MRSSRHPLNKVSQIRQLVLLIRVDDYATQAYQSVFFGYPEFWREREWEREFAKFVASKPMSGSAYRARSRGEFGFPEPYRL